MTEILGMTIERLREVLDYNPAEGTFIWKKRVSDRQLKGKNAVGYYNRDGYGVISLNRKSILAQKVAFILINGVSPRGMLRFKDGNSHNLKWENIEEKQWIEGSFDHSTEEGRKEYAKAYKEQMPIRTRESYLRCTYGIGIDQYNELFKSQGGCCAICTEPETAIGKDGPLPLAVDHDHVTGVVRGLLCRGCNVAIGGLKEKEENFLNAITYLEKHKQSQKQPNVVHLKGRK